MGLSGKNPAPGTAVAGADLAHALGVSAGDTVQVSLYGRSFDLTVGRIVPRRGIAGFWIGPGSRSPNLFVAAGTLREAARASGAAAKATPPRVAVAVWNGRGIFDGATHTQRYVDALENAVGPAVEQGDAAAPQSSLVQASVIDVKRRALAQADRLRDVTTPLLNALGGLSVLGGALMLAALFTLLASERVRELGVLRAVGIGRTQLVSALTLEGWFYAMVAGFLGMIGGIIAARVMVAAVGNVAAGGRQGIELTFSAPLRDVFNGMGIGVVIVLAAALLAAMWIARATVAQAQRGDANPSNTIRRWGTAATAAAVAGTGLLWLALAVRREHALGMFVAPAVLAAGLGFLAARRLAPTVVTLVLAGAVALWELLGPKLIAASVAVPSTALAAAGGVCALALVCVVVTQHRWFAVVLDRILGRRGGQGVAVRLGARQSGVRLFRSAVLASTIAVVVLTVATTTVLSGQAAGTVQRTTEAARGGYDLLVRSNPTFPVPAAAVARRPEVAKLAALVDGSAEIADGSGALIGSVITSFDATFVGNGPPRLVERDPRFVSDLAVYDAVATRPGWAIVPYNAGRRQAPGSVVFARDFETDRSLSLRVAGVARASLPDDAVLVGAETFKNLLGRNPPANRLAIVLNEGASESGLRDWIGRTFQLNGAETTSFATLARQNLALQIRIVRLLEGFLLLEIVAGAAGLAVVMLRSVRERRREIAVLRSIGYPTRTIRRAFVVEAAFIAVQGVGVGLLTALVTARRLAKIGTLGEQLEMAFPLLRLLVLAGLTLAVVLVATAIPARRAAALSPAAAFRDAP